MIKIYLKQTVRLVRYGFQTVLHKNSHQFSAIYVKIYPFASPAKLAARERKRKRRDRSAAFTRFQHSARNWSERFKRSLKAQRRREELRGRRCGKRFLYERIWRTSYFVFEKTACIRSIFVIVLYLDYLALFFLTQTSLCLLFPVSPFLFPLHTLFSVLFCHHTLEKLVKHLRDDFQSRPNCVARKSAPLARELAKCIRECRRVHSLCG